MYVVWGYVSCRGDEVVFFQAEDGIRDLVRSRGLGDVYKRQAEEYDEAFGYEWLTRRWAKLWANTEAQYADHIFPLSLIHI